MTHLDISTAFTDVVHLDTDSVDTVADTDSDELVMDEDGDDEVMLEPG